MSKVIRLKPETAKRLEAHRQPGDTADAVIGRVLNALDLRPGHCVCTTEAERQACQHACEYLNDDGEFDVD